MPRVARDNSVVAADHVSRQILHAFFVSFSRPRCGKPQVPQFQTQRLSGIPQEQGSLVLIPAGVFHDAG